MRDRFHFTIKPPPVWEFFFKLYGGTPVKRRIIKSNNCSSFDFTFQLIDLIILPPKSSWSNNAIIPTKPIYVNKDCTLNEVKERIVKVLNGPNYNLKLNINNIRMWRLDSAKRFDDFTAQLNNSLKEEIKYQEPTENEEGSYGVQFPGYSLEYFINKEIDSIASYYSTITMVLEQGEEGKYLFKKQIKVKIGNCESCRESRPLATVCKCKEVYYCSESCLERDKIFHSRSCSYIEDEKLKQYSRSASSVMGICGLHNIGNTCFMNSGLQCLSHSVPLSYYLLNNYHEKDLNPGNPLGSKCQLVNSYAKLIKEMWYESSAVVHPMSFKIILGKVNEIFKGFQQHDSQELINCILDIVHEDLNRVKSKPMVEFKTYNDETKLLEGSKECWNGFLMRNQSVVVDFFYGQFISRLKCPKCNVLSYKFDPFNSLSVPVPYVLKSELGFEYVPYDITAKCVSGKVKNNKGDTVIQFRKAVGDLLGIDPYSFMIVCLDKNSTDMERIIGHRYVAKKIFKQYTRRNDRIVLLQINPEVFKSKKNLGFEKVKTEIMAKYPKIEEKAPEKNTKKVMDGYYYINYNFKELTFACNEEECDFNHGLENDIIKVMVHMRSFEKIEYANMPSTYIKKVEPIYPRYLHISKSTTLATLHVEVFQMLRPLFNKCIAKHFPTISQEFIALDPQKAFLKIQELIKSSPLNIEIADGGYSNGIPYNLRVVSNLERHYSPSACYYCKKSDCKGCPLPASDVKLEEYMNNRELKEFKKYVDNNIFYSEHGFSNRIDFELELIFDQPLIDKFIGESIKELTKVVTLESITNTGTTDSPIKKIKTLDECLDSFTIEEQLGEEDTWYCPKCKDHVRAWKKVQINKAPHILVIHLKRFKGNKLYSTTGKIEDYIDCPQEIDLAKYIQNKEGKSTVYKLYGVVNHSGSLGFGHYTANCYSHIKNAWYVFNDSSCYEMVSKSPISNEAYVLFYQRKDVPFEIENYDLYKNVAENVPTPEPPKEEKKDKICSIQS